MTITTTSILKPTLKAKFRRNNKWVTVELLTAIRRDGVSLNEIRFEDGQTMIVPNSELKFG